MVAAIDTSVTANSRELHASSSTWRESAKCPGDEVKLCYFSWILKFKSNARALGSDRTEPFPAFEPP